MIDIINQPKISDWKTLLQRPAIKNEEIKLLVNEVFAAIEQGGDRAVLHYAKKFDNLQTNSFKVNAHSSSLKKELKNAIRLAYRNIYKFHKEQVSTSPKIKIAKGITCWQESRPIENVGLYIPGGTAPLFSTVLMLGIPARLAGCKNIILTTPGDANGNVHPAILFAAKLCGIKKIYSIGGIQAIAAMCLGTETIPKVDKIFGPGNQYVTAAKGNAMEYGVAIDMPAGPSELLVIADKYCVPAFVAADLLSQAEHGSDSQVILLSNDENILQQVIKEIYVQLDSLPRKNIAAMSLQNSKAVFFKTLQECLQFSNTYAPEHLILAIKNYETYIALVQHAGSVFLGNYSCESAGDYASGTNHCLPTNGFARNYSGLSVSSFCKTISFQTITKPGLKNIGKAVEQMAEAEELFAHKNAVSIRLTKKLNN